MAKKHYWEFLPEAGTPLALTEYRTATAEVERLERLLAETRKHKAEKGRELHEMARERWTRDEILRAQRACSAAELRRARR